MGVSFGIGSYIEGGVVAGIIFLNIVIGFMQEYSAEKTMDSLRSLSSPTSSVIRHGESMVIPTIHVVPGDMVELKTGGKFKSDLLRVTVLMFDADTVPADIRYGFYIQNKQW